uniref:Uncharacterized protein n=1 Tax=Octopus bimaculoides TaxID=37653 RepID=A0A0L8GGX6_OCTBM
MYFVCVCACLGRENQHVSDTSVVNKLVLFVTIKLFPSTERKWENWSCDVHALLKSH